MRTLSVLVYTPVLFTIVTACAPKHHADKSGAVIPVTKDAGSSPTAPTGNVVVEPSPQAAAKVDVGQLSARIADAKQLLQSKFFLPFDEEKTFFPVGIRAWVYTPEQQREIISILKSIIADATTLLDVTVDQDVVTTQARGQKILNHFNRYAAANQGQ